VDLEDRVESWNSQLEKLTGITREHAVGRKLGELWPGDLCEQLAAHGQTRINPAASTTSTNIC